MASKFKFGLRFEISKFNYQDIYVHIASNSILGSLRGHSDPQTASIASEVKFYLSFEISNLIYHGIHVHATSYSYLGGP